MAILAQKNMNRNQLFHVVLLLIGIVSISSCRKDKLPVDEEVQSVFGQPTAKPKGEVLAIGVSKSIGPEGGVLSLNDIITVHVPAGAVDKSTLFQIQPIRNTLDDESIHTGFRLLPEGVHFKQAVRIAFPYDTADISNPDTRMVAYQRSDGVWCGVPTVLDKERRQLTVETTHFSDWVWFDFISLRKDKEQIGANQAVNLQLLEMVLGSLMPVNSIDSVPLAAFDPIGYSKSMSVKNWKIISGPGSLKAEKNSHGLMGNALYTAPATVTKTTDVEIQVEIESKNGYISDPLAPNGRRKMEKLILITKIRLEPNNFFSLKMNGVSYDMSHLAIAAVQENQIVIRGTNQAQSLVINLQCFGTALGSYVGGMEKGKSFIALTLPRNAGGLNSYVNGYDKCPGFQYSGTTNITSVEGFIEGTFKGTAYYREQICGFSDARELEISFKLKRN